MSPSGSRLRAAAGPVAVVVLTSVAATQALQVWRWRPGTPLGLSVDFLHVAALVRGYVDYGPYANNLTFGAPFGMSTGWSSTGDDLHVWILTLIQWLTRDALTTMALYFFLCFPASALAMYWLARQYSITRPAAVMAGVLFAVLPGQQERFQHLFLTAYWAIPFAAYLIIETCRGRSFWRSPSARLFVPVFGRRLPVSRLLMLVCIALGDIYYVAFTLVIIAPILALRYLANRDLGRALRLALPSALVALMALGSIVFARMRISGETVTGPMAWGRTFVDSQNWAGQLIDLFLPWSGHRVASLATLTNVYLARTENYHESDAIGVVALIGVVGVLAVALSRLLSGKAREASVVSAIAVSALITIGYFWQGGLDALVAVFVTPQIRTWSRLFAFIAMFGLLAVGLWISWLASRGWKAAARCAALVLLLVGVLDQTNPARAPAYEVNRARLASLSEFGTQVAARWGPQCRMFELPVVQFPEVEDDALSDFLALGVAAPQLSWSFGAIKGTAASDWQLGLPLTDPVALGDQLAAAGFCGVVVHKEADTRIPETIHGLATALGSPIAQTGDGLFRAYDLRPTAESLDGRLTPDQLTTLRQRVFHPVVAGFGGVFAVPESTGPVQRLGPTPSIGFSNMSDRTQNVRVAIEIRGTFSTNRFRLHGLRDTDWVTVGEGESRTLNLELPLPPGQSTLSIEERGAVEDLALLRELAKLPILSSATVEAVSPDDVNVGLSLPTP
ncbi:hypothetical protein ACWEOW_15035 [Monashia sp. NPDC004114]